VTCSVPGRDRGAGEVLLQVDRPRHERPHRL
jgi:hypothetical protein